MRAPVCSKVPVAGMLYCRTGDSGDCGQTPGRPSCRVMIRQLLNLLQVHRVEQKSALFIIPRSSKVQRQPFGGGTLSIFYDGDRSGGEKKAPRMVEYRRHRVARQSRLNIPDMHLPCFASQTDFKVRVQLAGLIVWTNSHTSQPYRDALRGYAERVGQLEKGGGPPTSGRPHTSSVFSASTW